MKREEPCHRRYGWPPDASVVPAGVRRVGESPPGPPPTIAGVSGDPELHARALEQVRAICARLPEVSERLSHGSPTFFVRDKKTLCNVHDHHHGAHGVSLWCPAPAGVQEQLVEDEPQRFFRPPYVGHRGWVGVRLDIDPDWEEVEAMIRDAYRLVAPKTLVRQLG